MADAYDSSAPVDAGILANTTPAELRALKAAITGAQSIAANRVNKYLTFNGAGTAIVLSDLPQAASVSTTSGAALADLETNVNAIITALKGAGFMAT